MENTGIEYTKPKVILLQDTGIGVAEISARTCYDSFDASENACIQDVGDGFLENCEVDYELVEHLDSVNNIEHSDLLDKLAWTHFHHSILEHANLSFLIKGTSRGVLQEHARHRIQAISVRSTRYTMSPIINAFVAEKVENFSNTYPSDFFINTILEIDNFVTTDKAYNTIQILDIFNKLNYQYSALGKTEFLKAAVAKSSIKTLLAASSSAEAFKDLQAGKKKRNVGDAFKHIVNDNWKVDMVVTFNVRSLKNYFTLRDSGAAYFQIRSLAEEMKKVTPAKYLDLIVKKDS